MKPATVILCLYLGYATGSLQVLAFKDKTEGIAILFVVTLVLVVIAGTAHGARKPVKSRTIQTSIPKRSSVKNRSAKSKLKVVGRS